MIAQLAPDQIYLLPGAPRFIGYIPQHFRVYRGQVAIGDALYISRIEKYVVSDVVKVLRKVDTKLASIALGRSKLGLIKDFGTLANQSQVQGVPLKDTAGATPAQKNEARIAFEGIARKIIDISKQM